MEDIKMCLKCKKIYNEIEYLNQQCNDCDPFMSQEELEMLGE